MIFVFVKIGKFANVSSGKDRVKRRLGCGFDEAVSLRVRI